MAEMDLGATLSALLAAWAQLGSVATVLVFLGALIAFEGLRQFLHWGEHRGEAVNRRLRLRAAGKSDAEVLELLKPPAPEGPIRRLPIVGNLPDALQLAGVPVSPGAFLAFCGGGFLGMTILLAPLSGPVGAVALSAALCLAAPLALLRNLREKRDARLLRQLPDALDLMGRGLRVGHPVNGALQSVADEMPDPIGTEFGLVVDLVAYGEDLPAAMREMADRVNQPDMRYLATAVAMHHGTGGDLARVVATLARVVRSRQSMREKVSAISAEGRTTAYVLSALPILIAGFIAIFAPSYYGNVMHAPSFWPVMALIGAAVVANALILLKLATFRI